MLPEEATPCAEAFDSPDWRFSIEWEGARALLFAAEDGSLRLQAGTGADLTPRFPDVAAARDQVLRCPAVLDGVVAVLDPSGKPDLAALGVRLAAGAAEAAALPAAFLASDVLHLGGSSTARWPLSRRLDALAGLVGGGSIVQVPDHVEGRGLALAEAATARGLGGLLARRSSAQYRPGVASPDRLSIALLPRATCLVAGVEVTRHSPAGRLLLAEHVDGRLLYAGRVDGPRDRRADAWLRGRVAALRGGAPPADAPHHGPVTWLRAGVCATVGHAGRDAGGMLVDPQLIVVRDDVDPAWCVRRAPAPPPQDARSLGFAPTVLLPLPLDDAFPLPRGRS